MEWQVHHVALIASDYTVSKRFYTETLGLPVLCETYRAERDSWKLDLALAGGAQLELFSMPDPPPRVTNPEAAGLRHLCFHVDDIEAAVAGLAAKGVSCQPVRTDEVSGGRFTFFFDPDGLPLELHE